MSKTHTERILAVRPEHLGTSAWHTYGDLLYSFEVIDGERLLRYRPVNRPALVVDGIAYDRDTYAQAPMIARLELGHSGTARMDWSVGPMPEDELDVWVKTGLGDVGE